MQLRNGLPVALVFSQPGAEAQVFQLPSGACKSHVGISEAFRKKRLRLHSILIIYHTRSLHFLMLCCATSCHVCNVVILNDIMSYAIIPYCITLHVFVITISYMYEIISYNMSYNMSYEAWYLEKKLLCFGRNKAPEAQELSALRTRFRSH